MNRRELLGAVGVMGAVTNLGGCTGLAEDHEKMDEDKMMAPLSGHHLHFCGIHCAKKDSRIQIVTQHFCGMESDGIHQCLLYDSVRTNARLLGVEYIVSDAVFRSLPQDEQKYWHPHTD